MMRRPSTWLFALLFIGVFFALPIALTGGEWEGGGRIDWYEIWGLIWGLGVGGPALALGLIALIDWEDRRERQRAERK